MTFVLRFFIIVDTLIEFDITAFVIGAVGTVGVDCHFRSDSLADVGEGKPFIDLFKFDIDCVRIAPRIAPEMLFIGSGIVVLFRIEAILGIKVNFFAPVDTLGGICAQTGGLGS